MAPRRTYIRRNAGENEELEAPQEAPQVPADPLANQGSNAEFWDAFQVFAKSMMTESNREVVVPMNLIVGTAATTVRDFTRMNPLEFHGLKVQKNPQKFSDEVYKVLMIMGRTLVEKV
uniref:Gag-pol polyprotein n=1 Tax=Solanum tuberosum TaxID=4113 RepID=M1DHH0_SOLTU